MSWISSCRIRKIVVALSIGLTAGCAQVEYRQATHDDKNNDMPFERIVNYDIGTNFYRTPPRCVVVLPSPINQIGVSRAKIIETALARQLTFRVQRVIGPDERDRLIRDLALDLDTSSGRQRFSNLARCDTAIVITISGFETTFAVVWASASLSLSTRMIRLQDDVELWQAAHSASRSDGTAPISPASIPVGLFSAGRFIGDRDMFPSMVDDTVRRLLTSLPDLRTPNGSRLAGKKF